MHAKLSPSSAHRWLACPGSIALSEGIPNISSKYADEGTKAHALAAYMLNGAQEPEYWPIEEEMQDFVQVYVNAIDRAAIGKLLFVEMPIDISKLTGEPGAKGTADAVIVDYGVLEVHDLKYGMGHIVQAEQNKQLMLYALGVLDMVESFTEINEVKLVIHQPRRDHLSEWTISKEELLAFGQQVSIQAQIALSCKAGDCLTPSDEACRWCPAKATCPALVHAITQEVMGDFDDASGVVERLPQPDFLSLVEGWVAAAKQAIFEKLQRFEPAPGWKLVKGREGNRKWNDAAAVEELCKTLRITKGDSHEQSLKSPAQLEKAGLSPKKWGQIAEHITRSEAKPTMVEASDPRPALEPAKAEEFDIFA